MVTKKQSDSYAGEQKPVVITRVFNVPRELVFKAWVEPEHIAKWWGPHHFTVPHCEMDLRPGGTFLIQMQGPDGQLYPTTGTIHEVVVPEKLVITSKAFEDEDGNAPLVVLNTVTFEEHEGGTKLTLKAEVVKAAPEMAGALAGMEQGWSESLEKLADYIGQL